MEHGPGRHACLSVNPFTDLPRADQNAYRVHQRRALTEAELRCLLKVARQRPLAEYGREIVGKEADPKRPRRSRATWNREPQTIENIDTAVERARESLKDNPDLIIKPNEPGASEF